MIIAIVYMNEILSVTTTEGVSKIVKKDSQIYIGAYEDVRNELIEDGITDLSKLDEYYNSLPTDI